MRYYWSMLTALLLLVPMQLHAQPQAAPPPGAPAAASNGAVPGAASPALDPAHNRLDSLLLRWEEEMKKVQTLEAQCVRITKDKTFQDTDVFEGTAKYMKPNMAMLKMEKKGKPQIFEKYVCTGSFLYEYVPQSKQVRVHELPPPKPGQVSDDNFLSFLFGMRAEEAKRRYDLKLTKEDEHWIYIEVLPRFPADKADFQKAQLVLGSKTFVPRRLWFEQPNGNEITWDLPHIDNAARLNRTEFTSPDMPSGWSMVRVPRANETPRNDVQPRVIRQQN
jgi:TIGR03009 family protein